MKRYIIVVLSVLGLALISSPDVLYGQTFVETVKSGNLRAVKKLLQKKSVNVNDADAAGITGLMVSTIANDSVMVLTLLEAGADPNVQSKSGMSVLHAAAFNNRDALVPYLIAAGAKVNLVDSKGRTPLLVASYMGHTNVVTHLLTANALVEYKDLKGNTALMLACGNRHLGALEELLEKGADPNARDLQGRTPLMLLSVLGEDEMVRILLKHKADVLLVDHALKTALTYAKEYRRKAVIFLLEQAGAKY